MICFEIKYLDLFMCVWQKNKRERMDQIQILHEMSDIGSHSFVFKKGVCKLKKNHAGFIDSFAVVY